MSADMIRGLAGNNGAFAKAHKPSITFRDFPDTKAAVVVSCMDPRCNPNEFWNFSEQGPPVIRNAGGRVDQGVLRSIRALSTIMSYGRNTVGAVAVIHHTDCGMLNFTNEYMREKLKQRVPEQGEEIDKLDLGSFVHLGLEDSVREDVARIKAHTLLPNDLEVIGYICDVFSGLTTEVK